MFYAHAYKHLQFRMLNDVWINVCIFYQCQFVLWLPCGTNKSFSDSKHTQAEPGFICLLYFIIDNLHKSEKAPLEMNEGIFFFLVLIDVLELFLNASLKHNTSSSEIIYFNPLMVEWLSTVHCIKGHFLMVSCFQSCIASNWGCVYDMKQD